MSAYFKQDFIKDYTTLFSEVTEKEAEYIYRISSYEYVKMIINQYEQKCLPRFKWK